MNKRALRADLLLLLTACIWGFGFVAQRSGMEYVGPFTFNAVRFVLGSLSLLPLIVHRRRTRKRTILKAIIAKTGPEPSPKTQPETAFRAFLTAGSVLFVAVALQQMGIMFTTVGNAGFITGLYVVFTPVFGVFLKKKTGLPTWMGAVFTLTGLYFLSAAGHLDRINPGDIITIISAVFWALHVLLIDHLVQKVDPIVLSSGQFAWCGLLFLTAVFALEPLVPSWAALIAPDYQLQSWQSFPALIAAFGSAGSVPAVPSFSLINAFIPILYGGLASVGIAYTLQVVAQQDAPPAHATIILCLEGLFAALGGIIILGEKPGVFTILGSVLMLCGMLITQWEVIRGKSQGRPEPASGS
ncbi:MAG: DMT family transporter [Treponema sp.]|jgi:drug/metabolite transporter (DMT)-like permease|nr:DMT family transporter [Treponema sp.]